MENKTKLREYSQYLEFKKGTSNKFYEVRVKELETGRAEVWVRYGRIGTTGQRKLHGKRHNFDFALLIAKEQENKKRKKGYKKVSALEALASAIEEPEERRNKGLPPVELAIPVWNTGRDKTDERLTASAEKHLNKLNLVRASRWDLGLTPFKTQVEKVLEQYAGDFFRIKAAKVHAYYIDASTEQRAREFFENLKENTGSNIHYTFFRAHWRPAMGKETHGTDKRR